MPEQDAREISIADARNGFTRLVHEVEQGRPVAVTRRGRPVAVLISAAQYERLRGRSSGLSEAIEAYRAAAGPEDQPEGADPWAAVRDQSPGREVPI